MEKYKRSNLDTSLKSPPPRSKSPVRNKSKSPSKYYSMEEGLNIRRCKTIVSYTELELIIQDLIKNRQRILPCIQLHQLLLGSRLPPRCIEHNNAVSLYCTNEHRILCVNCIYSSIKHKTHKVNPLKDSMAEVKADVDKMETTLQKQHLQVKNQIQASEANQVLLDDTLNSILKSLQFQFQEMSKYLASKYIQIKTSIIDNYKKVITTNCVLTGEFQWLKTTLDATFINLNKPFDEQHLIRKQILLGRILEHTGVRCKVFKKQEAEILIRQFSKEFSKIKDRLQIQRWFAF